MKSLRIIPVLITLLCCQPAGSFAQKEKVRNLEDFDQKLVHFGFTLGLNWADFILDYDPSKWDDTATFLGALEVDREPGFNLGIVSDLHLGPFFNIRFIPQLSFVGRVLEYSIFNLPDSTPIFPIDRKGVESTYIDFPLNLKYRSARLNNFAAYFVGGAKYSLDLASQEKITQSFGSVVRITRHGYSWEVGFGLDFFLPYFKWSPEIKMSFGLNNLIIHDSQSIPHERVITNLRSKILLLSFTFEG